VSSLTEIDFTPKVSQGPDAIIKAYALDDVPGLCIHQAVFEDAYIDECKNVWQISHTKSGVAIVNGYNDTKEDAVEIINQYLKHIDWDRPISDVRIDSMAADAVYSIPVITEFKMDVAR